MSIDAREHALARGRGRPRSAEREQDILAATLTALVDEGYDAMTVEGVAARAGAGKATLYRRWPNKAELVADALRRHACANVPVADTGDIRADMTAVLRALYEAFEGIEGALLAAFTAERLRHPELSDAFERRFVADRRAQLRAMVQQAVDRGALPADADVDLLADVGPALLFDEFVRRRGRIRADLPERIVAQFFVASAAAPSG
jgi:AcrR family transcriptional regulator